MKGTEKREEGVGQSLREDPKLMGMVCMKKHGRRLRRSSHIDKRRMGRE